MSTKQTKLLRCPNCGEPVSKPAEGCVLHAMMSAMRDREVMSERSLRKLHSQVDADALWDDVGPILDHLESGYYNRED